MAVEHDEKAQKFSTEYNDEECFLAYTVINDNLNLHFMSVPDGEDGEKVAEILANAAFDYAKKHGVKIISSSAYIDDVFLKNHPELAGFAEKQW